MIGVHISQSSWLQIQIKDGRGWLVEYMEEVDCKLKLNSGWL